MNILTYDGSFDGLLSAIFYSFEYQLKEVQIQKTEVSAATLFGNKITVDSDSEKAERLWLGLKKNMTSKGASSFYKAYLSELPNIENTLLRVTQKVFKFKNNIDRDFTDPDFLKLAQIAKKVDREKHRMDAFVRFKLTKDDIYFAVVEPDFNVLPLNLNHFKSRYADQKWLIYDLKRGYGIFYNLSQVAYIELSLDASVTNENQAAIYFTEEELHYQHLWQNYFQSTNIESRKNMRLHVQHIPKRYWKHLSEKQLKIKV